MAEEEKSSVEEESKDDSLPTTTVKVVYNAQGEEEKGADDNGFESNKVNLPIQEILLAPENYVPTQQQEAFFEVIHHPGLPLLFVKRSDKTPQACLDAEEKAECVAITEVTLANSLEDIPYGFEVVRLASNPEAPANLESLVGSVEVEEKQQECEGEGRGESEGGKFLCIGKSEDPSDVACRGLCELRLAHQELPEELTSKYYEEFEVVKDALYVSSLTLSAFEAMSAPGAVDDKWSEFIDDMKNGKVGSGEVTCLGDSTALSAEKKKAELEALERKLQEERLLALIQEAQQQQSELQSTNHSLQKRIAIVLQKKTAETTKVPPSQAQEDKDKDNNYSSAMEACTDSRQTLKRIKADYKKLSEELGSQLDEKLEKARMIKETFAHYRREISRQSLNSRTGKPIPVKIIEQFEETQALKEEEVQRVRLKNIMLTASLKKLEGALREKEQLAEGLHLIDFEQLKIENQTLNEKIEERNEELQKLRKKTRTTVQVLTHVKEKLQFVQGEVAKHREKLQTHDKHLTLKRDKLTKAKYTREATRAKNETLRQNQGFVSSELLVRDYTKRNETLKELRKKVTSLQEKYDALVEMARSRCE